MTPLGTDCAICGLRIVERTTGWEHLFTVAGREASRDHHATPQASRDMRRGRKGVRDDNLGGWLRNATR
jgi:hypothetical protein